MSEHHESLEELRTKYPHLFRTPKIHGSVYIAPGAQVLGDVEIGEESSIWCNAVVRADVNYVRIGKRTNIQDLSLIHESYQASPTVVGDDVTVGHSVILHACKVGNKCLIGMGSVILDDAEIGDLCLIGAGSLVTQGTKIPAGTKAWGRPAKVVGELTSKEIERLSWSALHYASLARAYML